MNQAWQDSEEQAEDEERFLRGIWGCVALIVAAGIMVLAAVVAVVVIR